MKTFALSATPREHVGKKIAKDLRKQEIIPAVMYGIGENKAISVTQEGVRKMIYSPDVYLIELSIEGDTHSCILKEIQFHPVTDKILHLDFLEVSKEKPITVDVPVSLQGHARGVRAGGKLSADMRYLKVKGLFEHIPERLEIDVTELRLGKTLQVGDLSFDNIEILTPKKAVVAAVRLTRASMSNAAAAEDSEEAGEEGEGEEAKSEE